MIVRERPLAGVTQTLQVGLAREELDFVGLELFLPFPGGKLLGVVGGVLERAVTLFEVGVSVVVRVSTISGLVGTAIVMGWCWSVLLLLLGLGGTQGTLSGKSLLCFV